MGSTGQLPCRAARVVGPACADELIRGGATVVDVREHREWLAGHIPGARHLPFGRLASEAADLPRDRSLIVVCRSGRRSARAAAELVLAGFPALNLLGGVQAWHACGLPLHGPGSEPGWVV